MTKLVPLYAFIVSCGMAADPDPTRGGLNQPCNAQSPVCDITDNDELSCRDGTCIACGGAGEPCCPGIVRTRCDDNLICAIVTGTRNLACQQP